MLKKIIKFISPLSQISFDNNKKKLKNLLKIKETKKIFDIIADEKNEKIMFVGGCVRKALNKEFIDDFDLATSIVPVELKNKLKKINLKVIETGVSHGTLTVLIDNKSFEITTLREDVSTDGRHAKVVFTKDWNKDAERRDFTINAIYLDKIGNVFDPTNGIEDLKNGIV